jgi:hypothetical protein
MSTGMPWLETHLGDLENAVSVINNYGWHLTISHQNDQWYVLTGKNEKRVIFHANSRELIDTFLYGMGLAAVSIPGYLAEVRNRSK